MQGNCRSGVSAVGDGGQVRAVAGEVARVDGFGVYIGDRPHRVCLVGS